MSMADLRSAGIKIYGSVANQHFGQGVAAAGDINQDGYADFLISNANKQNVYLFYGGASLTDVTTASGSFSGVVFPNRLLSDHSAVVPFLVRVTSTAMGLMI
jgi:hypothetical protein